MTKGYYELRDDNIANIQKKVLNRLGKGMSDESIIVANAMYDLFAKQSQVLKIKRTEDAKQFPLIHIKKHGDVGFDLTAILPYKPEFQNNCDRELYGDMHGHKFNIDDIEAEVFREQLIVHPHNKVVVPTGVFVECPSNKWASIEARSSTSANLLLVPKGVIDEGYRGELFAVLVNIGDEPKIIKHGERYVQLIIHERNSEHIIIEEVDKLSDSERGDTGFGSTGKANERIL